MIRILTVVSIFLGIAACTSWSLDELPHPGYDPITGGYVKTTYGIDEVTGTIGTAGGLMGASCHLTQNPTICRDSKNLQKTIESNMGPYRYSAEEAALVRAAR